MNQYIFMNHLRKFNESIDTSLIVKYLEGLKDIFVDVEDEFGIDLSIVFYEFNKNNKKVYKTTNIDGLKGTFFTTSYYPFGYFSIEGSNKEIDFSRSVYLSECIERTKQYFDSNIKIDKYAEKGYIGAIFILEEPLS